MNKLFTAANEELEINGGQSVSKEELVAIAIEDAADATEFAREEMQVAGLISAIENGKEAAAHIEEQIAAQESLEPSAGVAKLALVSLQQAYDRLGAREFAMVVSNESIESNPESAYVAAIEEEKNFLQKIWEKIKEIAKKIWIKIKNVVAKVIIALDRSEKVVKALEEKWEKMDKILKDDKKNKFEEGNVKSVTKKVGTMLALGETVKGKDISAIEAAVTIGVLNGELYNALTTSLASTFMNSSMSFIDDIAKKLAAGQDAPLDLAGTKDLKVSSADKKVADKIVELVNKARKDDEKFDEKNGVLLPVRLDGTTLRTILVTPKELKYRNNKYFIPKFEYVELTVKEADISVKPELLDTAGIDAGIKALTSAVKSKAKMTKGVQAGMKILENAIESGKYVKDMLNVEAGKDASDEDKAKAAVYSAFATNLISTSNTYGSKVALDVTLNFLNNVKNSAAVIQESMKFYK